MARVEIPAGDDGGAVVICDRCGFTLDGVRDCDECGEPACPVCGCFCGHHKAEWDDEA